MVEGVLVVNRLEGEAALRMRTTLLESVAAQSGRRRGRSAGEASTARRREVVGGVRLRYTWRMGRGAR